MYRDYHLIVEWKWGGPPTATASARPATAASWCTASAKTARLGGSWLESIESQIIEGGAGDLLMVAGKRHALADA